MLPLDVIVVDEIVFAVKPFVKFVAPVTVPPVNEVAVLVLKPMICVPLTLPVPLKVIVPFEYEPPVTALTF